MKERWIRHASLTVRAARLPDSAAAALRDGAASLGGGHSCLPPLDLLPAAQAAALRHVSDALDASAIGGGVAGRAAHECRVE